MRLRLAGLAAVLTALATVVLGSPASAAPAAAPLPDGIIRLHNVNSGRCLTYSWDHKGAAFQQGCGNIGYDGAISEWYARNVGGNNYTFTNEANGQCLAISGSSTANGAAAFVWTCVAGLTAEIFAVVPTGGPDAFELVNVNSSRCVAIGGAKVTDGAWAIQWDCYGGAEELWRPY